MPRPAPPARSKSATTSSARIPRRVVHHWQAIHRGAFYRGGPIKTAISSGIDRRSGTSRARCYGVPVYKLLGGPTRDRVRVYGNVEAENGVNAMKVAAARHDALALQVQRGAEVRR